MNIVHISSGLGNQMLSYCELLALRKANPEIECIIENSLYDIEGCSNVICQWNGYELERIFGIKNITLKDILKDNYKNFLMDLQASHFWDTGFNYAPVIIELLKNYGISLTSLKEAPKATIIKGNKYNNNINIKNHIIYHAKRVAKKLLHDKLVATHSNPDILFKKGNNLFTGQQLLFMNSGNRIELIESEIRKAFCFPTLKDKKNINLAKEISCTNSVAIHARRGDMLQFNGECYCYGYFKRATRFVKKKIPDPVFYFFCDPGSAIWCQKNLSIFGLKKDIDKIKFVDWNSGCNSYIDMQLMSHCKHNIITNSSFGWWGAFLNNNPSKITCSPIEWINTTHHF